MTEISGQLSKSTPPIAPGNRFFGNMREMQKNPMGYMATLNKRLGDVVGLPLFGKTTYFIFHPDGIRHILLDNHRNYHKRTFNYEILYPLVGQGLLTSDGDFWIRQRRLAQPAFHKRRIELFTRMMVEETQAMCLRWQTAAQEGTPLNIENEMTYLTLNIVGKALLNLDMHTSARQFGQAFMDANNTFGFKNLFSLFFPWIPTPTNIKLKRAVRTMDAFVYRVIRERRQLSPADRPHDDLLSILMEAVDEDTGEKMTDQQLRDEIITILLAGHETTALGLTWTWYFLSQDPDIVKKLQKELAEVLGGKPPESEDFSRLKYTLMVFQEALRFFPPAWTVARGAHEADEVCGYHIPAGSILQVNLQLLHHDPRFWKNPGVFDPDRFTPERSKNRLKFAYLPFITGPRKCIGDQFALTEAVMILATVLQQFTLQLANAFEPKTEILITQRPKNNLMMVPELAANQIGK